MPDSTSPTVLLAGASRGLGLGLAGEYLARGWKVVATARSSDAALRGLDQDDRLTVEHVDITDRNSVAELRTRLGSIRFDLLFVVAGVSGDIQTPIHEVAPEEVSRVYLTNAYYPVCFAETFADRLVTDGSIAFMSSFLASISRNDKGGWENYRASKAALNMMARNFSVRHPGLTVLSVSPGRVRTDMGGPDAPLDVDTSVRGVVDAITAREGRGGHAFIHYDGTEWTW